MSIQPSGAREAKTSITPMLSVRRGTVAIEFYKAALGAEVRYRIDSDDGEVVARPFEFQPGDAQRRHGAHNIGRK
jgi:uncharacterized glyoxalase superfamily protein PhnB